MTGKITIFAVSGTVLALVAGCGEAKDPMVAVRDEFQRCVRSNDFVCVARLTPQQERTAMGFKDDEAAARFLEDYFWKVNVKTGAAVPIPENHNSGVGLSYTYRTASIPEGELEANVENSPTGPVVTNLYYQLILIDAASVAIAKGEEMHGTNKLRQFASFFRKEGENLTKEYGITGIHNSQRGGYKNWTDLADAMDASAAEGEAKIKAAAKSAS